MFTAWRGCADFILPLDRGLGFFGLFRTLEEYIRANPPKGLGTSPQLIEKLINNDMELLTDFRAAIREAHPNGKHHAIDIINSSKIPSGTSKAYALQKLSDEGEVELLDQVKAGKISASAAMKIVIQKADSSMIGLSARIALFVVVDVPLLRVGYDNDSYNFGPFAPVLPFAPPTLLIEPTTSAGGRELLLLRCLRSHENDVC